MDLLYISNTGVIELNDVKRAVTGEFINDAVVSATIQLNGTDVLGETWPVTMDYVADTDGTYRAFLTAALDLTNGKTYTAIVEAISGALKGTWNCRVVAQERPCE